MIKIKKKFKNKNQKKYLKRTNNFKNKNQIRKFANRKVKVKLAFNKNEGTNLVKKRIKEQIQFLLAVYKRNIIGTPVKITNIGAKIKNSKRPKVILENESGISKDIGLKQKVLAFRTRALAFKYKLTLNRIKSQLKKEYLNLQNSKLNLDSELIPNAVESYEKKYAKSFRVFLNNYSKKKKLVTIITKNYEHAINIRKIKSEVLGYNKISRIKINKKKWRKYLKIKKVLTKVYSITNKVFSAPSECVGALKKHKLIIKKKKYFRLLKKRFKTLTWLLREKRLRRSIFKAYESDSKIPHKVEFEILNDLRNEFRTEKEEEIQIKDYSVKLLRKYKEKTNQDVKILEDNYKNLIYYLTNLNTRTKKGLSKKFEKGRLNGFILKGITKQIKRITQLSRKKVITLVINKQEQKKPVMVKILLNILRGLGEQKSESGVLKCNQYLMGLKHVMAKKVGIYEHLVENIKMRMLNEILTKKEFTKILESQEELMKKYVIYCNIAKKFPKKWVKPEIFRPFIEEFTTKRRDYRRSKRYLLRSLGSHLAINKYNVVNNLVSEDQKIYNLRLPKKRSRVPTLKHIYKGLKKLGVPYYKTTRRYKLKKLRKYIKRKRKEKRLKKLGKYIPKKKKKKVKKKEKKKVKLKIGVLRIKIRRRNMFLVFRDRKTNKVEAVTTARKEYYRIYNTKEMEPGNKKRRDSKETVIKAKGPIGRYISTDHFRSRVLTQAFLDLRHKLRYKILDIEIEKKYKKRFVQTIYKKYWYVFKSQGVFRMCKFAKNKPHGRMRKKKARRI